MRELVSACGMRDEQPWGGYLGDRGTFRHGTKFKVGAFSLSGDAIAALRAAPFDAFGEWLTILAEGAHRVTRVDVALDVVDDGARVVREMYARARRGRVTITRKKVPAAQVNKRTSPSLYGSGDTGTVYIGARKRDVWARVYDKRQELLQRVYEAHGELTADLLALNDPGPLTRYELVLGRHVGATMRDVYEPAAVFWHFARESLLASSAPMLEPWQPNGVGFAVPRSTSDPARQLSLLVDSSCDIRRAVTLADRLGPHGRKHLHTLLAKVVSTDEQRALVV
jgi:hypothetical protein